MDGVIRNLIRDRLPPEEQARLGILPDRLCLITITRLCCPGESYGSTPRRNLQHALLRAGEQGHLIVTWDFDPDFSDPEVKALLPECPPPYAYVTRSDFRQFLEAQGEPLPGWWFTEAERRAAQAHQSALARHGYTTVDEHDAKEKARRLWKEDPIASKATMRKLCAVKGKPCPQTWIDEVHKSLNLPKNRGGRPRCR